jgi:hypothetical protein
VNASSLRPEPGASISSRKGHDISGSPIFKVSSNDVGRYATSERCHSDGCDRSAASPTIGGNDLAIIVAMCDENALTAGNLELRVRFSTSE